MLRVSLGPAGNSSIFTSKQEGRRGGGQKESSPCKESPRHPTEQLPLLAHLPYYRSTLPLRMKRGFLRKEKKGSLDS